MTDDNGHKPAGDKDAAKGESQSKISGPSRILLKARDKFHRYKEKHKNPERRKERRERWTVIGLFAAAGFALLQWNELRKTDHTLRDTLDLNRRTLIIAQRAFVSVKELKTTSIKPNATDEFFYFTPEWQNSGGSPTVDLVFRIDCEVMALNLDRPFDFNKIRQKPAARRMLGPHLTDLGGACVKSSAEIKDIQSKGLRLYIGGIAIYEDIFSQPHETRYCVQMEFFVNPAVGSIQHATSLCARDNCADQECEKQK